MSSAVRRGLRPQAFAVETGDRDIVQVTQTGFTGMLSPATDDDWSSWKAVARRKGRGPAKAPMPPKAPAPATRRREKSCCRTTAGGPGTPPAEGRARAFRESGPRRILEIDLAKLLRRRGRRDGEIGGQLPRSSCGTIPATLIADGNMGVDANDDFLYFRVNGPETTELSPGKRSWPGFGRGSSVHQRVCAA